MKGNYSLCVEGPVAAAADAIHWTELVIDLTHSMLCNPPWASPYMSTTPYGLHTTLHGHHRTPHEACLGFSVCDRYSLAGPSWISHWVCECSHPPLPGCAFSDPITRVQHFRATNPKSRICSSGLLNHQSAGDSVTRWYTWKLQGIRAGERSYTLMVCKGCTHTMAAAGNERKEWGWYQHGAHKPVTSRAALWV